MNTHTANPAAPEALASLVDDLVTANRILFHQGIFDAFGHISARHPGDASRFLLSRNLAPGLVTAADIVQYQVGSADPVSADAPRGYLERYIHSEIYKRRPDVQAVVHNHSPAVLPFTLAQPGVANTARFRPVCHMSGFLGAGARIFEIRDTAGPDSDLLIRSRELGAALADTLANDRVVLMRGHGCTLVAENVRVAVFRSIYTELNARLLLQALQIGDVNFLTPGEAEATRITNEGQVERPWQLWKAQALAQ